MLREILRICFLFTVLFEGNMECGRILGIFPGPTKSHFVMFEVIMKGLAARGHEVDVVSHFPLKEPLPRYHDLSIKGSMPLLTEGLNMTLIRELGNMDSILELVTVTLGYKQCEIVFKHSVFKDLFQTKRTYDAVITETFGTDCMLGFGYHFKVPNIVLISSVGHPWVNDMFGNPDNPSYIANYYSPYSGSLNFWERLINSLINIRTKIWYKFHSDIPSNKIAKDFFGQDLPDLADLANNVSLGLVNSHYSINGARPMVPNYVEVGGVHVGTPKPVPQELEEYLNNKDGRAVIYFSLGSIILAETFDHDKLQGIFDTFSDLSKEYKVLWKAVKSKFPSTIRMPDNVKFIHWSPQLDVLCHPNVKVFITHGGLMGTQEAVYCGTPMIGMPMFADQEQNVNSYSRLGILKRLHYDDITKETFFGALSSILYEESYAINSGKVSEVFRDRIQSPLETSMFWIEYVLKYGSPSNMLTSSMVDPLKLIRSAAADLPWFQYYLVDVVVLLFTVLLFTIFVIKMMLLMFCRCIFVKRGKEVRKRKVN